MNHHENKQSPLKNNPLDVAMIAERVLESNEFQQELEKERKENQQEHKAGKHIDNLAVASLAARVISIGIEKDQGEPDLQSRALAVFSRVKKYHESQQWLNTMRDTYPGNMPFEVRREFQDRKRKIRLFNRDLKALMKDGADQFTFDDILRFLTDSHKVVGQKDDDEFYEMAESAVRGMRNELVVEQLFEEAGIEYVVGTSQQDAKGGDYFVNGVGLDFKSSILGLRTAQERAVRHGHDPDLIIDTGARADDFLDAQGNDLLRLPPERAAEIAKTFIPKVLNAVGLPARDIVTAA